MAPEIPAAADAMKGAVNCQHSMTESCCALAAMVVMFNVLGSVAVAVVGVVWRRNLRLRRRIMQASGMVMNTTVDVRAKFLIISLYPGISMQWHRIIGCCGRKRYPRCRDREFRRRRRLGESWYKVVENFGGRMI